MSMNYDDVEVITNVKCAICGDKLADWEINICILCEDQTMDQMNLLTTAQTHLLFICIGYLVYAIVSKK